MHKLQILFLVFLLILPGCSRNDRLDTSGVEVSWLEQTAATEAPPTMPQAPVETAPEATVSVRQTEPTAALVQTEPTAAPEKPPQAEPVQETEKRPMTQAEMSESVEKVTAEATAHTAGMAQTTLELSDGSADCWLYTPETVGVSPGLIVYLHGGSGKGDDLSRITEADGFPKYLQSGLLGSLSSYVLIPQLPENLKGWSDMDARLMEMIGVVTKEYGIDTANISLTGHSMGGTGAWSIAAAHPGFFARVAPLSGSIRNTPQNVRALKESRIYAFVGTEDTIVKPESSIAFVNALTAAGGDAILVEIEGADHFAVPGEAYLGAYDLIAWLQGS